MKGWPDSSKLMWRLLLCRGSETKTIHIRLEMRVKAREKRRQGGTGGERQRQRVLQSNTRWQEWPTSQLRALQRHFDCSLALQFGLLASTHKLELPVTEDPGPLPEQENFVVVRRRLHGPALASRFSSAYLYLKVIADFLGELRAQWTIELAQVARNPNECRHPRLGQRTPEPDVQGSNTGEQRIRCPSCSGMQDASECKPCKRHTVAVCQHVGSKIKTGWLWHQGVSFLHNAAQANLQGKCHIHHLKVCPCAFHEKPLQLIGGGGGVKRCCGLVGPVIHIL